MSYTVITETEKQALGEETPLVLVNLCLPRATEKSAVPFGKRFNAYYGGIGAGFARFARDNLQKQAKRRLAEEGFKPYGAVIRTVLCRETDRILSLYLDAAVTTDSRRMHRSAQLWDKENARLIGFDDLFVKGARRGLLPLICKSATARSESAGVPLFADGEGQMKKHFNKSRFYLSPQGVVFFYQGGVISNRAEPFPVHIPLDALNPYLTELGKAVL